MCVTVCRGEWVWTVGRAVGGSAAWPDALDGILGVVLPGHSCCRGQTRQSVVLRNCRAHGGGVVDRALVYCCCKLQAASVRMGKYTSVQVCKKGVESADL